MPAEGDSFTVTGSGGGTTYIYTLNPANTGPNYIPLTAGEGLNQVLAATLKAINTGPTGVTADAYYSIPGAQARITLRGDIVTAPGFSINTNVGNVLAKDGGYGSLNAGYISIPFEETDPAATTLATMQTTIQNAFPGTAGNGQPIVSFADLQAPTPIASTPAYGDRITFEYATTATFKPRSTNVPGGGSEPVPFNQVANAHDASTLVHGGWQPETSRFRSAPETWVPT